MAVFAVVVLLLLAALLWQCRRRQTAEDHLAVAATLMGRTQGVSGRAAAAQIAARTEVLTPKLARGVWPKLWRASGRSLRASSIVGCGDLELSAAQLDCPLLAARPEDMASTSFSRETEDLRRTILRTAAVRKASVLPKRLAARRVTTPKGGRTSPARPLPAPAATQQTTASAHPSQRAPCAEPEADDCGQEERATVVTAADVHV